MAEEQFGSFSKTPTNFMKFHSFVGMDYLVILHV